MIDPEIGLALDTPENRLRLLRVPEPLTADFQRSLTWLELREHLYAAAVKLISPSAQQVKPNAPPSSPAMLERYRQRITAARTLTRAQLDKLPALEQIEVLRFRITHGQAIGTGATAEALVAQDARDDYFKLSALRGFSVNEVNVGKDLLRGVVGMSKPLGFGEYDYASMVASRTMGGHWGFELDHRRAHTGAHVHLTGGLSNHIGIKILF